MGVTIELGAIAIPVLVILIRVAVSGAVRRKLEQVPRRNSDGN